VAIAREVLVDGVPKPTAAERHEVTQLRVGAIIERALAATRD
jgi:hypothetical protein